MRGGKTILTLTSYRTNILAEFRVAPRMINPSVLETEGFFVVKESIYQPREPSPWLVLH